jgi:hypothetical protein
MMQAIFICLIILPRDPFSVNSLLQISKGMLLGRRTKITPLPQMQLLFLTRTGIIKTRTPSNQ